MRIRPAPHDGGRRQDALHGLWLWRHEPDFPMFREEHRLHGETGLRIARARTIRWAVLHVWAPVRPGRPAIENMVVQWRWLRTCPAKPHRRVRLSEALGSDWLKESADRAVRAEAVKT